MNELLSPFLFVLRDEVDAFRCFEVWMGTLKGQFQPEQPALQAQMAAVGAIVRAVDPELAGHLAAVGAAHCYFCFRWLLVRFKQEFEWEDILRSAFFVPCVYVGGGGSLIASEFTT